MEGRRSSQWWAGLALSRSPAAVRQLSEVLGLAHLLAVPLSALAQHQSWAGNHHSWEVRGLVCLLAVLRWVSAPLLWTELVASAQSQNSVGNHSWEAQELAHLLADLQSGLGQRHVMELGAQVQNQN